MAAAPPDTLHDHEILPGISDLPGRLSVAGRVSRGPARSTLHHAETLHGSAAIGPLLDWLERQSRPVARATAETGQRCCGNPGGDDIVGPLALSQQRPRVSVVAGWPTLPR